jgi:starch synthase
MQIYFIDNDDYFQRKYMFRDKNNKFFKDNDERAVFFSRGVIETVKKLGWAPDLIHCHGWMTSLVPLYIKRAYKDNPLFTDTRVVLSVYDDDFEEALNKDAANKIKLDGITNKDLKHFKKPSYVSMMKAAIDFSDGVIQGSETVNQEILDYVNETDKPMLEYQPLDRFIDAYNIFYDKILNNKPTSPE